MYFTRDLQHVFFFDNLQQQPLTLYPCGINWSTEWDEDLYEPSGNMRCCGNASTPEALTELIQQTLKTRREESWGDGFLSLTDNAGEYRLVYWLCGSSAVPVERRVEIPEEVLSEEVLGSQPDEEFCSIFGTEDLLEDING